MTPFTLPILLVFIWIIGMIIGIKYYKLSKKKHRRASNETKAKEVYWIKIILIFVTIAFLIEEGFTKSSLFALFVTFSIFYVLYSKFYGNSNTIKERKIPYVCKKCGKELTNVNAKDSETKTIKDMGYGEIKESIVYSTCKECGERQVIEKMRFPMEKTKKKSTGVSK